MSLETIKARVPDYAKDLRLNLDSVLSESGAPGLSPKQIAIVALASAIASRHEPLTEAIAVQAASVLSAQELDAARARCAADRRALPVQLEQGRRGSQGRLSRGCKSERRPY